MLIKLVTQIRELKSNRSFSTTTYSQTKINLLPNFNRMFNIYLSVSIQKHHISSLQVYSSLIPWHPKLTHPRCTRLHQANRPQGTHKRTTVPRAEAVAKSCPVEFKRIALTWAMHPQQKRPKNFREFFGSLKKGTI